MRFDPVAGMQPFQYDCPVTIGLNIRAWRLSQRHSVEALASKAGLAGASLEALESGESDPPVSTLEALAVALGIPPSWLYAHPTHVELLTTDPDGEVLASPSPDAVDPVVDHILQGIARQRELYVLLTTILQGGDPKLLRAAEASLRSLAKQSRQATIPWQSRISGHFEPPTD